MVGCTTPRDRNCTQPREHSPTAVAQRFAASLEPSLPSVVPMLPFGQADDTPRRGVSALALNAIGSKWGVSGREGTKACGVLLPAAATLHLRSSGASSFDTRCEMTERRVGSTSRLPSSLQGLAVKSHLGGQSLLASLPFLPEESSPSRSLLPLFPSRDSHSTMTPRDFGAMQQHRAPTLRCPG